MRHRRNQARWIALMIATGIALYLCWQMLQPFVEVLAWAAVLVVVFHPVHRRLVARTGKPSASAALSSLLVVLTILLPVTLIVIALVHEFAGFAQNLQANVQSLLDPNSPGTGRFLNWLGQYVDVEQFRSQEYLAERLKGLGGAIAPTTLRLVGGLGGVVIEFFFVIFTMYYLFRDGNRIVTALPDVFPLERAQSEKILARTREVISASLYGVLVIATIQGTLGGLMFWILGLPSPIVWGVVMTLLSMIPMAGAFIVWVPAALFLAATGHWTKAIILAAWGALVIGTVDNFLRPKLVGEKTKLHELFIFFSVIGGLKVFGVLGIVLGPVVLAVTLALLDVFRQVEQTEDETEREPTLVEQAALKESGRGDGLTRASDDAVRDSPL
ncbi:MAG TPA: AI-2E family transporter [Pyrinomonadaceae bacterium]|jgi:predicted PurR-regulated permease PerM